MSREKVLVILVDYNTADLVPDVLKSIHEEEVEVSILIVDNASKEESFKKLQKLDDPRVHLLRLNDNMGFTGGNNVGLKYAIEKFNDFQYVFLLNTDAYINPNLIGGLKKILDANKDAACISPKIFSRDGRTWYGGANFDFAKGKISSHIKIADEKPLPFYEVDLFSGCAVLFRLDRFLEIGMLNERLFMYYEEADCSIKLKEKGYKILYAPAFTVLHDVSFASRNISHLKTYYITRNKFFIFNKTMTSWAKVYYLVYQFAYFVKNKKYKNAVYLIKGFVDFKKGKTGRIGTAA